MCIIRYELNGRQCKVSVPLRLASEVIASLIARGVAVTTVMAK